MNSALPFLIVHGAAVWKVGLAVFVVGGLAAVWAVRRLRERRRIQGVRSPLAAGNDEGTVRGRLGGRAATIHAHDRSGAETTCDWRTTELWIDTDAGRVVVDGPVRVVAGSRARAARNGVPAATPAGLLDSPGIATWLHRTRPFWRSTTRVATLALVVGGDQVIARGRLERGPSDDPTGYRDGKPALTLRPLDDRPVVVAARAAASAVPRLSLPALAIATLLAGAIGWKLESAYGEHCSDACAEIDVGLGRDPAAALIKVELSNTHVCALAAAMPGSREDALDRTAFLLETRQYRDDETMRQIFALAELRDGCSGLIRDLFTYERYAEAADAAQRCGDARSQHLALVYQGKFADAAAVPVADERELEFTSDFPVAKHYIALPDANTAIAVGDWRAAAAAAAKRVAAIRADATPASDATRLTALHYECVAELFRHYSGDTAAAGRLRALAAGADGATCLVALLEIATPDERRALLDRAERGDQPKLSESSALLALRTWSTIAGRGDRPDSLPEAVLADPEGTWIGKEFAPEVWMTALAPVASAQVLRWKTVAEVFDGDLVAAAATAQQVQSVARAEDPTTQLDALRDESQAQARDRRALMADLEAYQKAFARGSHGSKAEAAVWQARVDALSARSAALDARAAQTEAALAKLEARSAARRLDPDLWGDSVLLPALVALHGPVAKLALPTPTPLQLEHWQTRFPQLLLRSRDLTESEQYRRDALQAAQLGDGQPLLDDLNHSFWIWKDSTIMAVLPMITVGRDALARQLPWLVPETHPSVDRATFVFDLAAHAVARRDALQLAGDRAEAARWDAIYRRVAAVLKDRQKLVALLLWKL